MSTEDKKIILITGGSGSIGLSLIKELEKKHIIYNVSRHPVESEHVKNISLDLSSDFDTALFPQNAEVVIHLAQSENFRNFPEKAIDIFNTNTVSTAKLADFAVKTKVKKFIYASSGGIYGSHDKINYENDVLPVSDLGFYLSSKLCSEIILDSYKNLMDTQVLRFFFVYGPYQTKSMLIPRLIEKIKNGQPI
ncbi:MAG: NAD(P)-dependent oxidoreductase, partial [Bacteroidia bacterium]|nr:NAD(P)-dependent oxidoreductase [Bacteroidia bacterium]